MTATNALVGEQPGHHEGRSGARMNVEVRLRVVRAEVHRRPAL
jgi:hypothetical protein